MKLKYIPIIGEKYKDWTVISNELYKKDSNRATYWKVKCKCGKEGIRDAAHLVANRVNCCRSCAALKLPFEKSYFKKVKERSIKMNFKFDINLDYILSIFNGKCTLSGLEIKFGKHWRKLSEQTASLDRIDSSKGYVENNVQWVHKDINMMKGKLSQEDFINLCKRVSIKCG